MYGLRPSAHWPRVVAVSLIGLGVANCSDSGRFRTISPPRVQRRTRPPARSRSVQRRQAASRRGRCRMSPAPRPTACPVAAAAWAPTIRGLGERRRHRLAAARSATAAEVDLGRRHAGHGRARRNRRNDRAPPWRSGERDRAGQQSFRPDRDLSRPASGDPALRQWPRPRCCRRRGRALLPTCRAGRSVRRRPRSRRRAASMSSRPARRSTAFRGSTASRCWCSPAPTTLRRTRC